MSTPKTEAEWMPMDSEEIETADQVWRDAKATKNYGAVASVFLGVWAPRLIDQARHYAPEQARVEELRRAARLVYNLSLRATDEWERLRKALEAFK